MKLFPLRMYQGRDKREPRNFLLGHVDALTDEFLRPGLNFPRPVGYQLKSRHVTDRLAMLGM
ncbi:hypothetical protein [Corynebacterium sp. A21]|uniref:hypothetical protein n=1 Tax=Corynebacterium sp. A21 TaxID=3457318 RepID=UPI003FD3837C